MDIIQKTVTHIIQKNTKLHIKGNNAQYKTKRPHKHTNVNITLEPNMQHNIQLHIKSCTCNER